jgi:glucose/arabinose dehydrogenase
MEHLARHRCNWSILLVIAVTACGVTTSCSGAEPGEPVEGITVPEGFTIRWFAADVPGARSLALGSSGTIFVGTRRPGRVYAVQDTDGDFRADRVHIIAQGLRSPNGVAFRDGDLYVAEISQVLRFENIEDRLDDPPQPVTIRHDLPTDGHHGWKFIRFGPDAKLYVPVGAPCNVCEREDPRYASILRMDPDGSGLEVFASGVRNTVGFDWHPGSKVLWFTDNGRDWLGDEAPPDELNRAPEPGLHFGFPYCHGGEILDPEHGSERTCDEFVRPAQRLGPHVAALGMRFYTGANFPEAYRGDVFIAEHGSWNRSVPIGYRLTRVRIDGSKATGYEVFAEGWVRDGDVRGRPVDLLLLPDGSILVSDDHAGAIYRISYVGS